MKKSKDFVIDFTGDTIPDDSLTQKREHPYRYIDPDRKVQKKNYYEFLIEGCIVKTEKYTEFGECIYTASNAFTKDVELELLTTSEESYKAFEKRFNDTAFVKITHNTITDTYKVQFI